jgi:hypothetical protein
MGPVCGSGGHDFEWRGKKKLVTEKLGTIFASPGDGWLSGEGGAVSKMRPW